MRARAHNALARQTAPRAARAAPAARAGATTALALRTPRLTRRHAWASSAENSLRPLLRSAAHPQQRSVARSYRSCRRRIGMEPHRLLFAAFALLALFIWRRSTLAALSSRWRARSPHARLCGMPVVCALLVRAVPPRFRRHRSEHARKERAASLPLQNSSRHALRARCPLCASCCLSARRATLIAGNRTGALKLASRRSGAAGATQELAAQAREGYANAALRLFELLKSGTAGNQHLSRRRHGRLPAVLRLCHQNVWLRACVGWAFRVITAVSSMRPAGL